MLIRLLEVLHLVLIMFDDGEILRDKIGVVLEILLGTPEGVEDRLSLGANDGRDEGVIYGYTDGEVLGMLLGSSEGA